MNERTTDTRATSSQKLWSLCHILRDDGITYNEYVTELTFLLFLKMMQETGREERLPNGYRWTSLARSAKGWSSSNITARLLLDLGNPKKTTDQTVLAIFTDAQTKLRKPANLKALTERHRQARLVLGARGRARQSLRGPAGEERRREEERRGAVLHAAPADRLHGAADEAAARRGHPGPGRRHRRLSRRRRPLHQGPHRRSLQADRSRRPTFSGTRRSNGLELVPDAHRLCLMNLMLHGIEGMVDSGDTLSPGRRAARRRPTSC